MPPPGGAPFPIGTVLNTHGTGDYPNFHYQGTVSQGIAGLLTVRYFESPHYYNCVSVYTYSQCSSMMSRGHMTLDPTAGYSRVEMAGVRVGDPVRVRWDDGTHYQATVRKCNSDGTLAVTYPDGGGAKDYASYVTTKVPGCLIFCPRPDVAPSAAKAPHSLNDFTADG